MTPERFTELTGHVAYQPRGIFFSELYLFLRTCVESGVNCLIESGVKAGVSTRVLEASGLGPVFAVDYGHFDLPPLPGVLFVKGNGSIEVPRLAAMHADEIVGVLVDGPKKWAARDLKDVCLALPHVRVVACHDVSQGNGETWHSHDPRFRAAHQHLDARIPDAARARWPQGSGLGVWVKA
jgi:hypothetical protein